MRRRHTTNPIEPISRVAPVAPVGLDRISLSGRIMFAKAQHFYRSRLRKIAKERVRDNNGA